MDWNWLWLPAVVLGAYVVREIGRLENHTGFNSLTLPRKQKKALNGPKLIPKHKPDKVAEYACENDRRFYRDFAPVADMLNMLFQHGWWTFENTGELETSKIGAYGVSRKFDIFYNQQRVGWITVSCKDYGNQRLLNDIRIKFQLFSARMFGGHDVRTLVSVLGEVVLDTPEEQLEADTKMRGLMTDIMWQVGTRATHNPEIDFEMRGKAKNYLSGELWK